MSPLASQCSFYDCDESQAVDSSIICVYSCFQSAGYFEEAPKVVRAPVVKRPPPPSPSPASVEKASNPIALRYWNQCHGADRKISEPALLSPRWRIK